MTQNALTWFEIPVRNIERAQSFYEKLLGAPLKRDQMGEETLAIFGYDDKAGVGGALVAGKHVSDPAQHGTLVYLNAAPSLDAALSRLEAAGGRIATPKTALPGDMGVFAHIIDTEGNRVGLHTLA